MELAKITSKGQITLPISIRRKLKLKEGDKVAFIEKEGNYIIVNPLSLEIDNVRKEYTEQNIEVKQKKMLLKW